jgi:hypothetical protein
MADNWEPRAAKVKNMNQARALATNACLVKIMKKARQMNRQQLIELLVRETSQLFPLSMDELRRCVQVAVSDRFIEEVDAV